MWPVALSIVQAFNCARVFLLPKLWKCWSQLSTSKDNRNRSRVQHQPPNYIKLFNWKVLLYPLWPSKEIYRQQCSTAKMTTVRCVTLFISLFPLDKMLAITIITMLCSYAYWHIRKTVPHQMFDEVNKLNSVYLHFPTICLRKTPIRFLDNWCILRKSTPKNRISLHTSKKCDAYNRRPH